MDRPRPAPCVVPVSAADALAWAAGRLNDRDLLLRSPLVPEAVFIVNLPDRASYPQVVRQLHHWAARGAVFVITRTGTAAVARHLEKQQGLRTLKEETDPVKYRFIVPPDGFKAWLGKLGTTPLSGVAPGSKRPS